jgi:hypothetical protein
MCKINSGGDGVECPAVHVSCLQAHDQRVAGDLFQRVGEGIKPDPALTVGWYHETPCLTQTQKPECNIDGLVAFLANHDCHWRGAVQAVALDVPSRPAQHLVASRG